MKKKIENNENGLLKKLFCQKLTKNEMDDVFFYYKQIIGIIAGVICGILHIKGLWGFLFFFILQFLTSFALYNKKIHENYFLDNFSIATSNIFIALSAFLVSWITINTLLI
ncbi:Rab5-interacting protein, putative [Plasmodium gallinaceum]|uniref:Rab5-interacting protein, putative n=1 Tax=Plasmodium gallinaceum TaxID=5849 RepID=A0A1J1GLS7_PLAGA|nr:Rab5-interacting protein, putative [Plasmodium gallinaceum]CRG93173.1 Rab5-interacting protein, putative [Plasmodium gallinaceum]